MGRYKGKREAPKSDAPSQGGFAESFTQLWSKNAAEEKEVFPEETSITPVAPALEEDPFAEEVSAFGDEMDPFDSSDGEKGSSKRKTGGFLTSTKGKVIVAVVGCLLAFIVGGLFALDGWIKPPDVPVGPGTGASQQQNNLSNSTTGDEPYQPTDDELYPDDGYDGDVPTVSGDRKEGVYTFLLVGTDKDDGNTDTIMVVSYDTVNQDINIMSIPRDTMINEKWDIKKINSVYSRTGNSINALANRVQKLIGFKPDFYVKVELSMFVELVDLIGGVDFYVPQNMNYDDPWQDLHIHLEKGQQVLDGAKAMQLVRFRSYPEGDIQRVRVQQDFMKALIKECISLKHWGKIKAYIELGLNNVQTDLDFGSVVWFAANVLGLNDAPALDMANVNTYTMPGNYIDGTWCRSLPNSGKQSYVTIYPNQVVKLVNESFNPYVQNVTTGMLDAMSILENGDIASSTGVLKDTQHNEWMAVRRGEGYYDEDGVFQLGQAAVEPERDALGNYYILEEDGNIVYTDEKGTPLSELLPGGDPDRESGTVVQPGSGTGTDPEEGTQSRPNEQGQGSGGTERPTVQQPQEPSEPTVDSGLGEIPDWLNPDA